MPREEQWESFHHGIYETTCCMCGEARDCLYVPDPYIQKIQGADLQKEVHEWYCKPCWTQRRDYDGE